MMFVELRVNPLSREYAGKFSVEMKPVEWRPDAITEWRPDSAGRPFDSEEEALAFGAAWAAARGLPAIDRRKLYDQARTA